jgi:outer membrane protein assembly factor BamE
MIRAYYDPDAMAAPPVRPPWPPPTSAVVRHVGRGYISRLPRAKETVRKLLIILLSTLTLSFAAGCVYQASLSQGNLLKQADLDQVKVGMTRSQVRFLLGTPMIDDPFHEERWDYVYYLKVGRDKATFKRWVSIFFDGDTVREIVDDQELEPDL